jgi:hypothetical protein
MGSSEGQVLQEEHEFNESRAIRNPLKIITVFDPYVLFNSYALDEKLLR